MDNRTSIESGSPSVSGAPALTGSKLFSLYAALICGSLLVALNPLSASLAVKMGRMVEVYLLALDVCLVGLIVLAAVHVRTGRRRVMIFMAAGIVATPAFLVAVELIVTYVAIRYHYDVPGILVSQVYESDPKLGWRLIPGTTGRHVLPGNYDVTYHTDRFGRRVLPAATVAGPTVHIFGSSFTFSDGVADDQAAVYLIADAHRDRFRMQNYSVSAYGLDQMVLDLELNQKEIAPGDIVVLPTTSMSIGWSWIARAEPCQYRIGESEYPVHKYPILTGSGWRYLDITEECGLVEALLLNSALPAGKVYSRIRAHFVRQAILDHADQLFAHAKQVVEARGARLISILLLDAAECKAKRLNFDSAGLKTPLVSMMPYCLTDPKLLDRMSFPNDWHYTAEGNRWFAGVLTDILFKNAPNLE